MMSNLALPTFNYELSLKLRDSDGFGPKFLTQVGPFFVARVKTGHLGLENFRLNIQRF